MPPPIMRKIRGPKNKKELLAKLYEKTIGGDWKAPALAYIVGDIVPDDRTTKHVFRCLALSEGERR